MVTLIETKKTVHTNFHIIYYGGEFYDYKFNIVTQGKYRRKRAHCKTVDPAPNDGDHLRKLFIEAKKTSTINEQE